MTFRDELIEDLKNANNVILEFLNNKISFETMIKCYNNFYYFQALDGHEASNDQEKILSEFQEIIFVHKFIQTEIIDLSLNEDEKQKIPNNRISIQEAEKKMRTKIDVNFLKVFNQKFHFFKTIDENSAQKT